jgi:hypothetical protein
MSLFVTSFPLSVSMIPADPKPALIVILKIKPAKFAAVLLEKVSPHKKPVK